MKANELRLGNYVLRNGFLQEDKETFNKIVVSHNDITACVVASESFKPIPITEEWFLKLGFHKYKGDNSDCFLDDFETRCNRELFFWKGTHLKNIEYVHQLQNIYFALTGGELTLKSE